MIVSRRNDTVLSHWSRSVALCLRWLCIFLMILKSLNLFVSSMTTVLNLRSTEMVMLLKESFLKVSIITGLLFLHLTRPVNSPISQIPFGTRNSFSMFSTMISMCQLCLWPLVSLRIFSVRTISPTLMVISSCPLANISSGINATINMYKNDHIKMYKINST